MFVIPSRLQQVQVLLTSELSNYDFVSGFSVLDMHKSFLSGSESFEIRLRICLKRVKQEAHEKVS